MSGCHVQPEQMFNLIFGYNDRVSEDLGGTKSGGGAWDVSSSAIPSDEIWIIQFVFLRNITGPRGTIFLRFHDGSNFYIAAVDTSAIRYIPAVWNGSIPLKTGDTVNVYQSSCLNNDVIEAGVWGYKMKVIQ